MPLAPDAAALAALLPGTWRIGATNFPMWLRGDRLRPYFRYDLKTADPLVLDDVVGYTTADGVEKTIVGVDRMRHDGFVWRGAGLLRFVTSRPPRESTSSCVKERTPSPSAPRSRDSRSLSGSPTGSSRASPGSNSPTDPVACGLSPRYSPARSALPAAVRPHRNGRSPG
jgi:hypothetical protein